MSMVQYEEENGIEALDRVGVESVQVSAVSAMVKSEVEAQLDAAHRYPRQIRRFISEAVSLATIDQEVAMSCMYSLPRGGKAITGPSIRLAEICASAYGNLHVGARVVAIEEKEVVAQGVTWDLEKNLRATIEVRRRITKKDGKRFDDDMITVTGNAAASIGLRNAIFRVIPRTYVNMVYERAREVALGKASSLSERRAKVFERLVKMGALQDRILAHINRPSLEEVTIDDLELLIGIGTAIKNGDIHADAAFPAPKVETGKLSMSDLKPQKPEEQPQPAPKADIDYCDADDFRNIETAAADMKVKMKAVYDHIQKTMGIPDGMNMPKVRKGEVLAWINAQKK
jgi:hypothetical protein